VVDWYKDIVAKQWVTSFGLGNCTLNKLTLFNTQLTLRVPTNIGLARHLDPTKTYFWYAFLMLYKKPVMKKFNWPANLQYQDLENLEIPIRSVNNYQKLGYAKYFFQYFFQHLHYFNFKPHRRTFKLQKYKVVFKAWDSIYLLDVWSDRIIYNYKFPFIYLKFYFFVKLLSLTRIQASTLLFLNSFQNKVVSER
jgi:hypothetical protein